MVLSSVIRDRKDVVGVVEIVIVYLCILFFLKVYEEK